MIFWTSSFINQQIYNHSRCVQIEYIPFFDMGVHKYSHCFTRVQLERIIDDYLGLGPYYRILHRLIKEYVRRLEEKERSHPGDRPHPIKIYTKDYLSKNFQEGEDNDVHIAIESPKCDIRTTYSSTLSKFYYIYPLQVIIEILESEDYYKALPKNIIINQLLSTDNIQIIIETLTILSEEMSKKIKSTLASKDVRRSQHFKEKNKEEEGYEVAELAVIEEEKDLQSRVEIPHEDLFEEDEETRKAEKKRSINPLVRTDAPFNPYEMRINDAEKSCVFCQNYLLYLSQNNGDNYGDDCLNKLSKECIKHLKVIAQTVTHFTLYLMQSNLDRIPNDIHVLNKVLNYIGIVITEDIFNSELNPKNAKPAQTTCNSTKPKTLIDHLVPYFTSEKDRRKQRSKDIYAIDELLRMVIYCPTVEEVSQQLKNYQVEQFQRQGSLLKSENQEKVKALLRKDFNYIKDYERELLEISKNTVNTKPIYKQLQFQEEVIVPPSTQPQNYNVNTSLPSSRTKSHNNTRYPFLEKSVTIGPTPSHQHHASKLKENKSLLVEMSSSLSQNLKNESKDQAQGKNGVDRLKFKKQSQATIANAIKRNLLKSPSTQLKSNTSVQPTIALMKPPTLQHQPSSDLSDQDFKKLLYSQFAKNQGFNKSQLNPNPNSTAPAFNNFLSSSVMRSTAKKTNGYSNTLNIFIGRKQEEQHFQCMEKLEKETYNRQLLNGEFVRNEIYEEIRIGNAKIYENFDSACGLAQTLHFQEADYPSSKLVRSDSNSSRRLQRMDSSKKRQNVIHQNSTKFNQSGLIRNQKYNKSIKSQLINHRQDYLRNLESQNLSRMHLAHNKSKKVAGKEGWTVKEQYEAELQRRLRSNPNNGHCQEPVMSVFSDLIDV